MKKTNTINLAFALCVRVLAFFCGHKKTNWLLSNTESCIKVKQSPITNPNNADLGAIAKGTAHVQSSFMDAISDALVSQNISTAPSHKTEKFESKQAIAPLVVAPAKETPRKITREQKKEIKKALQVGS